jgi:hypothetical protein
MSDNLETPGESPKFDPSAYPPDTFFYERRTGQDRRAGRPAPIEGPASGAAGERRQRKERRRRVDPTTFEKQYSPDELEFMAAMQAFKVRTAKAFPTYAEVLAVAKSLGYRREGCEDQADAADEPEADAPVALPFTPMANGHSH